MELSENQYKQIAHLLPRPRGSFKISHYNALRAILYVAETGCSWRKLPEHYGNWHTIYTRMNRWAKQGILNEVFIALQKEKILTITVRVLSPDTPNQKSKYYRQTQKNNRKDNIQQSFIWVLQRRE